MPVLCGLLHRLLRSLLLLLAATGFLSGWAAADHVQSRRICGSEFDEMYWARACDMLGKRSQVPPLAEYSGLQQPLDGSAGPHRFENSLLYRVSPWSSGRRRQHSGRLSHRSPQPGPSAVSPRWLHLWKRSTDLRGTFVSKRSRAHYNKLLALCCFTGCHEQHFAGIC
ncbi:uncharacterized protein LOC119091981 [Pollicipes pollicipes]|uniref:uncharacterized protein LOC119091981 n=1 Tax=Pollicipes pollicipes TaxID=41117 RepID=UPI0018855941|nr:uncharacterized protein LOC119091981 [Pollicipes pollicipes]